MMKLRDIKVMCKKMLQVTQDNFANEVISTITVEY